MSETFRKFRVYRDVFGPRGWWLAIKTRLARAPYDEQVSTPQGPIFLRLKTSDLNAYAKVFLQHDYDFPVPGSPRTIIDAGANLGFASIYFARKYPGAKIFAIEPESSNFSLLKKNVRPFPNVVPIQGALWNEDTQLDLVDPGIGHWGFQVGPNGPNGPNGPAGASGNNGDIRPSRPVEKVRAFSIATLRREFGFGPIDILKVDIEGAEKELFAEASGWINDVGAIMVELHDRWKPGCTESFEAATRQFPIRSEKGENIFRSRA